MVLIYSVTIRRRAFTDLLFTFQFLFLFYYETVQDFFSDRVSSAATLTSFCSVLSFCLGGLSTFSSVFAGSDVTSEDPGPVSGWFGLAGDIPSLAKKSRLLCSLIFLLSETGSFLSRISCTIFFLSRTSLDCCSDWVGATAAAVRVGEGEGGIIPVLV